MRNQTSALILVFFWFLNLTFSTAAQTLSEEQIDNLLKKVEVQTIDAREMALVPLRVILEVALERSLSMGASRLGEESAKSALTGTRERNHPSIQTSYGLSKNPSSSFSSSSSCSGYACGSSSTTNTLSATFTQRLDSGITYGLTLTDTVSKSTQLIRPEEGGTVKSGTTVDPSGKYSLRSFVSIPFFQDSGFEINNIPVKMAKIAVDRAGWSTRLTRLNLLKQIASIYWDMVGIYESIEVQKKSVTLSKQLLSDNEARSRAGLLRATEVMAAETQLLRDRQILDSLKYDALRVEDQVRAALNLPELPVGLFPSDKPRERLEDLPDKKELLKKIIGKDSQLALNRASLMQNRHEIQQLKNRMDTNLDLDLSYTLNGYSKSTMGGTGDFGNSDLQGMSASLSWAFPIGDRNTQEQLKQKNLERRQIELQMQERESELRVTVESIFRSIRLFGHELQTAKKVIKLYENQLENEILRSKVGQSTSFQLSQHQKNSAESRQQEIMIRVRLEKAFLELLVLSEDLFDYYQISID